MITFFVILYLQFVFICAENNNTNNEYFHIDDPFVSGHTSRIGQFPFIAAYQLQSSSYKIDFCGGSLLNEQWVLTAAHCLINAKRLKIQFGIHYINEDTVKKMTRISEKIILHPDYDKGHKITNDLALIYLKNKVRFTDCIKPIALPTESIPTNKKTKQTFIGIRWGEMDTGLDYPTKELKYVFLGATKCKHKFSYYLQNTIVCVTGKRNHRICQDNSGVPLVQMTAKRKPILVGISSFSSKKKCRTREPLIYTKIFEHKEWIDNVIMNKIVTINAVSTREPSWCSIIISSFLMLTNILASR